MKFNMYTKTKRHRCHRPTHKRLNISSNHLKDTNTLLKENAVVHCYLNFHVLTWVNWIFIKHSLYHISFSKNSHEFLSNWHICHIGIVLSYDMCHIITTHEMTHSVHVLLYSIVVTSFIKVTVLYTHISFPTTTHCIYMYIYIYIYIITNCVYSVILGFIATYHNKIII